MSIEHYTRITVESVNTVTQTVDSKITFIADKSHFEQKRIGDLREYHCMETTLHASSQKLEPPIFTPEPFAKTYDLDNESTRTDY